MAVCYMALFFCDNCGTEVPRNSKRCPRCGRHFASVRCPRCGFTGEEFLFKDGCPLCGYCAPSVGGAPPAAGGGAPARFPDGKKRGFTKIRAGKLPLWVYALTAALLAAAVILILTVR
jgi:predicted RNA-binding Zn-ribbon protein involved in translation (DUF1610 family)